MWARIPATPAVSEPAPAGGGLEGDLDRRLGLELAEDRQDLAWGVPRRPRLIRPAGAVAFLHKTRTLVPFSCLPATLSAIVRYTTFRFALAPTPAQASKLARHAGASRFALINAFNGWKNSEDAGRMFVVTSNGAIDKHVTGLPWRREVSAQVLRRLQSTAPGRLPPFETPGAAHLEADVFPSQNASAKAAAVTVSGSTTSSTGRCLPDTSR
jgi:hypothetical protein